METERGGVKRALSPSVLVRSGPIIDAVPCVVSGEWHGKRQFVRRFVFRVVLYVTEFGTEGPVRNAVRYGGR